MLPFIRSPRNRPHLGSLDRVGVDILVYDERGLRSAIGQLARGIASARVLIARDITLSAPVDISDTTGNMPPFEIACLGGATVNVDGLSYVFGIRNSGMTFRNIRVRRKGTAYSTHFLKGLGAAATISPLRVIDCDVHTAAFFDDGNLTIGNCIISGCYLSYPGQAAVAEYMLDINATGILVVRDCWFSSWTAGVAPATNGIRVTNNGCTIDGGFLYGDVDVPAESRITGLEFAGGCTITLSGERCRVSDCDANSGTLDINIDTGANECAIRGNALNGGNIVEVNSGGNRSAIQGNTGVGSITTNLGSGYNTIQGNTGNGAAITITEHANDIVTTADGTTAGDYNTE